MRDNENPGGSDVCYHTCVFHYSFLVCLDDAYIKSIIIHSDAGRTVFD